MRNSNDDFYIKKFVREKDYDGLVRFMKANYCIEPIISKDFQGIIVVDGRTGKDVVFIPY